MKKKLHSIGVLSAAACCTLAYAATSNGPSMLLQQVSSSVQRIVGNADDGVKSNKTQLKLTIPDSEINRILSQVVQSSARHKAMRTAADSVAADRENLYVDTLCYNTSAGDNVTMFPVGSEEMAIGDDGVITMRGGSEQKNYFLTAVDNSTGNIADSWTYKQGFTYSLKGTLEADTAVTVVPCMVYSSGESNMHIVGSQKVTLDEANGHSGTFDIATANVPAGSEIFLAFIVMPDTLGSMPTVTLKDLSLYASCEAVEAKPWNGTDSIAPGLGLADYNRYGEKYVLEQDSMTTYGVVYDGKYASIVGINTAASSVTVPNVMNINGELVTVENFGNRYNISGFDWSCAPSLTSLDLSNVNYIYANFSGSAVTDLYCSAGNAWGGYIREVGNIYLHLPYGAYRNDNYGYKRVLIGEEQPDYPVPSCSDYVIAGDKVGEYFGISMIDGSLCVTEIFSESDTVSLPVYAPYTDKNYYVTRLGREDYSGYGTLLQHAKKLKSLIVPENYNYIDVYWDWGYAISELHMQGSVPGCRWNVPSTMTVYVSRLENYNDYSSSYRWNSANILPEGWDFEWLTIDVARKGEFAQTYIEKTDADWGKGMYVKVTGTLNSADLKNISNLTSLMKIDLSEAVFDVLPDGFLQNKSSLIEVTLPDNLTGIAPSAFYSCQNLKKVVAPGVKTVSSYAFYDCRKLEDFDLSGVTVIGNEAFEGCSSFCDLNLSDNLVSLGSYAFCNTAVTKVSIPEGITELPSYVFSNCQNLAEVSLPSTVTKIGTTAFGQCKNLAAISLPESLVTIGNYAFNGCALRELTLPSNVQSVGSDFITNCDSLKSVKCKAVVPPTTNGSFTSGIDLNHCVLYVAPFAIDAYRDAECWNNFYIIKALDEPVKNIYISRPMAFDLQSADNAVLQDNPNMTLAYKQNSSYYNDYTVGQLTANGDGTLSAGVFDIMHRMYPRSNSNYDLRSTLVNNAENMRADSVVCTIEFYKNTWHFISFQYDVLMSDIYGLNSTDFVIRQYNSEKRALGDADGNTGNWEDVAADGKLEAGKGYIIQAANNSTDSLGNTNSAVVVFPSRNTLTKNKLFASTNVIVPLDEYPAEFAHNRSWNLIGNPYPCYYDMHYLMDDFTTPIVLWRGSSYQAYSPVDDDIILRPNEAFFVQRPLDKEEMTFGIDGRMHFADARNTSTSPGYKAPALHGKQTASRSVFNFCVEGNGSDDRTRIVLNESATMAYDISTDAGKFFAETSTGAEIYVSGDVNYDICERPLDNGIATLGLRVAKAGTYTLSLNGRNIDGWTAVLTDKATGTSVVLNDTPYLFEAMAGDVADRFVVTFKHSGTTAIDGVEAADGQHVHIYNNVGAAVYEGDINGFKASAPAGIYVVVDADKAYKIVIK